MDTLTTLHGPLTGVSFADTYDNGNPRFVVVTRPNTMQTTAGALVPQYLDDELRRPRVEALAFHPTGQVRSVPLQERAEVRTPLGSMLAELVTFWPSGAVGRVFPLNGKLSGHWAWQDEAKLMEPLELPTPAGPLRAKFIAIAFHESGALRSLTMWPDEAVELDTPVGRLAARIGVAFYESGALRSLEPSSPLEVHTPIGTLRAYHNDPEGINGDVNSLQFTEDGRLAELSTVGDVITVTCPDGSRQQFRPVTRVNPCDGEETELTPLQVSFGTESVTIGGPDGRRFSLTRCSFQVEALRTSAFDIPFFCAK